MHVTWYQSILILVLFGMFVLPGNHMTLLTHWWLDADRFQQLNFSNIWKPPHIVQENILTHQGAKPIYMHDLVIFETKFNGCD